MTLITPTPSGVSKPQSDLIKSDFEALIWQKGYQVYKEQALKCPCVSKNTNQLSNCKNCGGVGWVFINSTKTRMILHSMNLDTKYKDWTQENLGTVSVTCLPVDELSYMDRITVIDGNAIFSEVLFLKESDDNVFYFNTIYSIKEITFIAMFRTSTTTLLPLTYNTDFTYSGNKIVFLTASNYINPLLAEQDISITIRYKHSPQFHVLDIPRETMQTFNKNKGKETGPIDLPIHAVARRSHYVLDAENYAGDRILNNDHTFEYTKFNPEKIEC